MESHSSALWPPNFNYLKNPAGILQSLLQALSLCLLWGKAITRLSPLVFVWAKFQHKLSEVMTPSFSSEHLNTFFSLASRTQDKEIKYVNFIFIFISMIKWHIHWLFIMVPSRLWTEPTKFPLALKKPRNWNRNVDTALLYKLSDSYCENGTVIKSAAGPFE